MSAATPDREDGVAHDDVRHGTAGHGASGRGASDHDAFERWQHGGRLEGVHFAPRAPVVVLEGDHAGRAGRVVSLQALAPEPVYVVALRDGDDVGVVQSGLRAALPSDAG
ncbi:MAG TPA: hypothetical protein VFS08_00890 [Gemmatimonadaceae bacterium]|nr:hypothetical protein [Gemmatimonadaceae bacterium]